MIEHVREGTITFWSQYAVLQVFFSICVEIGRFFLFSKKYVATNKSDNRLYIFIGFLYNLSLFLYFALGWASKRFPLHEPEIVYGVLNGPIKEGDTTILPSISGTVILPSFVLGSLYWLWLYKIRPKGKEKTCNFRVGKFSIILNQRFYCLGLVLTFFLFELYCINDAMNVPEYIKFIARDKIEPVFSEFYDTEYVNPSTVDIVAPKNKKNLIYIFMESMESSFSDTATGGVFDRNYIPNLTKLAQENISFSNTEKLGGGFDAAGTGWTVAALLSKMAGIPYAIPSLDANPDKLSTFLPNVITLTDILAENGYSQRFLFGSDKKFASRDTLLETHGNVEIHDIEWYKDNGMLAPEYYEFWGFEDNKLYEFAKQELIDLSSNEEPFMLGILTVDTHFPNGYLCSECSSEYAGTDKQLLSVVECADRLVYQFIEWIQNQAWYEDTVIVVVGDHLFMNVADDKIFPTSQILHQDIYSIKGSSSGRRWLSLFINTQYSSATVPSYKNRKFSSFDMFPTVLDSMGFEIEGNALGFGRSLFSRVPTIYESYDEDFVNEQIMSRTTQYMNFMW